MAIDRSLTYIPVERIPAMPEAISEDQADERPCLHCMMVELIDDFFAEYPAAGGGDTDEIAGESKDRAVLDLPSSPPLGSSSTMSAADMGR